MYIKSEKTRKKVKFIIVCMKMVEYIRSFILQWYREIVEYYFIKGGYL